MVAQKRDYAAERARRNARAREAGYTSHDAMTRARRAGRTAAEQSAPKPRAPRIRTNEEARDHDRRSKEWSDQHSQQPASKFNGRWNAERKEAYFQAFVRWRRIPNDERDFTPTYDYLTTYGYMTKQTADRDPYAHA